MSHNTVVVNVFSSFKDLRRRASWTLALKLFDAGISVECLPEKEIKSSVMYTEDTLETLLEGQVKLMDDLAKDLEVIITNNPISG